MIKQNRIKKNMKSVKLNKAFKMKNLYFVIILLICKSSFGQNNGDLHIDYFGQATPKDSALIFAPGIISMNNRLEHAGVFSSDGKEFYFSVVSKTWDTLNTYMKTYINGKWTKDELAPFSSISGGAAEIFINKQNTIVLFVSSGLANTSDGWLKTDFWISKRNGNKWIDPQKLEATINNIDVQWHPSISCSGHVYFGSRGFIYKAKQINDTTFEEPHELKDSLINLKGSRNAEPFIASDESFLIFSSNRSGGYGGNDLYITFKKEDNTWTNPKNLGPEINSEEQDFSPHITPDGKFLMFTKEKYNGNSIVSRHIYWVSTSFIEKLKEQ